MRRAAELIGVAAGLAVGALAVGALSSGPQSGTGPHPVVSFHADYPEYATLQQMATRSDLVVAVRLTGESRTVLLSPEEPADPSDPRQNPSAGVDPAVLAGQPEVPPIVTTVRTAEVTKVVRGDARVGDRIEVQELGGTYKGVAYVSDDSSALQSRERYMLFLERDGAAQPYHMLNSTQAVYPEVNGKFRPLPGNRLPLTGSDIAALTR
jgi:hypothetical protein